MSAFEACRAIGAALNNGGWTQGACARDPSGAEVPVDAPNASCFCLSGAVLRFTKHPDRNAIFSLLARRIRDSNKPRIEGKGNSDDMDTVIQFNDHPKTTLHDVLEICTGDAYVRSP